MCHAFFWVWPVLRAQNFTGETTSGVELELHEILYFSLSFIHLEMERKLPIKDIRELELGVIDKDGTGKSLCLHCGLGKAVL